MALILLLDSIHMLIHVGCLSGLVIVCLFLGKIIALIILSNLFRIFHLVITQVLIN